MPSGWSGFWPTATPIQPGSPQSCSMPGRRFTSPGSPGRSLKGSAARAKWWRRGRRAPPSTGCARRRLVFPDNADDHALDDHVTLVHPQRLHGRIRRLQPDPAPRLATAPPSGGAVAVHQGDDGLAGVGLVTLLHDDVVAVLDVLVDHRVAAHLEDVAAPAARHQLIGDRDRLVAGNRLDRLARGDQAEQRELGGAGLALGRDDLDRTALVVRAPDEALPLEVGQMLVDRGERLEVEVVRDLFEARGIALGFDVAGDEVQNLALAAREGHCGSRKETEA